MPGVDLTGLVVPSNLAHGTARSGDPARAAWLGALPGVVAELAERWGLRLEEPFEPGGTCSWVAPARDAAGRDAVLKVAWRHWEARDEAAGMAAWAGAGAAEVFAVDDRPPPPSGDGEAGGDGTGGDGGTTALLLERCRPGTPLTALPVAEQHGVVGSLLRQLHAAPLPAAHGFRSLTSLCDAWGASAERGHAEHPEALDAGLVREGLRLWHDLPRDLPSGVREALLVTDLHAGNVLSAQREPWLLVDPKPHVGDPHYDVVQHLLNCEAELHADPAGLARRVAGEADLDGDRVVRWLFARCVQECWEWADLRPVAQQLAADAAVR